MDETKSVFINRELSWLRFNSRVLAQCEKALPPLEKLKGHAVAVEFLGFGDDAGGHVRDFAHEDYEIGRASCRERV